jgi:membrane fusion protein, heavy metal efflux system
MNLFKNFQTRLLNFGLAFFAALSMSAAYAGPGHDHGNEAAPASTAAASPRISSHSDLFELVGILEKGQLVVYLDRYASNEPVRKANIELEIGNEKLKAAEQADGTYLIQSEQLKMPATLAMSFTITDGKDTDLLAGDLVIADPNSGLDHSEHSLGWKQWLGIAAGGVVALLVLASLVRWAIRTRAKRGHAMTSFFIAASVVLIGAVASMDAQAGPGHDHGDETPAAGNSNAPKRQADGSVFLPKPSQRLLDVRTLLVQEQSLPKTIELAARVVPNPNASGKVQPTQAGRIEAGPRGIPAIGQTVRKGEVLAVIRSSVTAIEKANQTAAGFEAQTQLELARKRLARLEQLEGSVPAKEIEAARAEVQTYTQRSKTIGGSVSAVEHLVAPVSGVVAASYVVAGQVVDAREVLFDIVDPARLMIEANAFDAALISNIASARMLVGTDSAQLRFMGAGRSLREGAIPVMFGTDGNAALPLAVGQSLRLLVQMREQVKGFALPTGAVVKSTSNQDMVWVHTGAEKFEPRVIRFAALDGSRISVISGLKAGDRVVTQGAALVNQVR